MVGLRLDNSSLDSVTGLTCISIALRVVARASLIVIEIPPRAAAKVVWKKIKINY
jgi:hypothetical protein